MHSRCITHIFWENRLIHYFYWIELREWMRLRVVYVPLKAELIQWKPICSVLACGYCRTDKMIQWFTLAAEMWKIHTFEEIISKPNNVYCRCCCLSHTQITLGTHWVKKHHYLNCLHISSEKKFYPQLCRLFL